jgi:N-acylneuraminate cytidylyltransferase
MNVLAVVPARGGSKNIKYKNIVNINGLPLIYYVTNELLKTSEIDKVVVSTDDFKIKDVVLKLFGDQVQVLDRPKVLAGDKTTSEDVIEYVINQIGTIYDNTMLVQCTSPLTEHNDFTNLIQLMNEFDSAAFYIEDDSFFFNLEDDIDKLRAPRRARQQRELRKKEIGNAWIFNSKDFLKYKTRLFGNVGICKIDSPKELEIDDPGDLILAECLLKRRKK